MMREIPVDVGAANQFAVAAQHRDREVQRIIDQQRPDDRIEKAWKWCEARPALHDPELGGPHSNVVWAALSIKAENPDIKGPELERRLIAYIKARQDGSAYRKDQRRP